MNTLSIAVLSDIHGNRWALEAVLEDMADRGIQKSVNLGDSLYGPLDPGGTADLLLKHPMPAVHGNEDRILLEPGRADHPTVRYVKASLAPEHVAWLESLPPTRAVYGDCFACHGTPARDDAYLLMKVMESGTVPRNPEEVADELSGLQQPVVLCGHDHLPRVIHLDDSRLVVDPGSVGLPAFQDDHPFAHAMETGSSHARYAVLTRHDSGWKSEGISLKYDWSAASEAAAKNGRPDWAAWLKTGRAG
jgi:predicted phosphodiesterase